jgi:hypothetical protein
MPNSTTPSALNAGALTQTAPLGETLPTPPAAAEKICDEYFTSLAKGRPVEMEDFIAALGNSSNQALRAKLKEFLALALTSGNWDSQAQRAAINSFRQLVWSVGSKWADDYLSASALAAEQEAAHESVRDVREPA